MLRPVKPASFPLDSEMGEAPSSETGVVTGAAERRESREPAPDEVGGYEKERKRRQRKW